MEAHRIRRRYDHRLQRLVHETGDVQLAIRHGVPRSTARDWSRCAAPEVVTLDVTSMSERALQREVTVLRKRNAKLLAVLPHFPHISMTISREFSGLKEVG